MSEIPYVISAELGLIAEDDEIIDRGEIDSFRSSLDDDLREMGKNTLWIQEQEIQKYLNTQIASTALSVVSLDDGYVRGGLTMPLGLSRTLGDTEYTSRVGYDPIELQLDAIAKINPGVVVLVDDVVYSGNLVLWVKEQLAMRDIRLRGVIAAIGIRDGTSLLQNAGLVVELGWEFESVDDEICERDFTITTGSGRRAVPSKRASIPEDQVDGFWTRSLERSRKLLTPDADMADIGSIRGMRLAGNARKEIDNTLAAIRGGVYA